MTDQIQELATATGHVEPVMVGEFAIEPVRMRQLGPFAKALKPLLPSLNALMSDDGLSADGLLSLLDAHADDLIQAVAIGSALDEATVGDLHPDLFVELALTVFRVNADFFAQRLLSKAGLQLEELTEALKQDGSAPSSG